MERHRRAAARRPPRVRRDDRYVELAARLRAQWKAESATRAEAIFDELELESGVKRSLLESERFRALLAEPVALLPKPPSR